MAGGLWLCPCRQTLSGGCPPWIGQCDRVVLLLACQHRRADDRHCRSVARARARPQRRSALHPGSFLNLDAADGFQLRTFDLTPYRGRTVRISLEAVENSSNVTSFIVDDFSLVIQP